MEWGQESVTCVITIPRDHHPLSVFSFLIPISCLLNFNANTVVIKTGNEAFYSDSCKSLSCRGENRQLLLPRGIQVFPMILCSLLFYWSQIALHMIFRHYTRCSLSMLVLDSKRCFGLPHKSFLIQRASQRYM